MKNTINHLLWIFVAVAVVYTLTGCASAAQKSTTYCDSNWQGRYDSWQACYDRQMQARPQKNFLQHVGEGMQSNHTVTCTTFGATTTCH